MAKKNRLPRVWKRYFRAIQLFDRKLFAAFTNIGLWIMDKSNRIRYDPIDRAFIFEGTIPHRFAHKARIMFFLNGPAQRGADIGKQYLLNNIEFSTNDIIVDCGANIGDFELYFYVRQLPVQVVAVEPSPVEYSHLKKNIMVNTCVRKSETYNVALWRESGTNMEFYIKSDSADSSLFEVTGYDQKVSVRVERLDTLLARKAYRLLKIEAEGAEPEVLEGAEKVLDCFDYIVVDAGFERGIAQESTLREVTNFLLKRNFEFVDINPKRVCVLFRRIQ